MKEGIRQKLAQKSLNWHEIIKHNAVVWLSHTLTWEWRKNGNMLSNICKIKEHFHRVARISIIRLGYM